jgi:hypothetical protein
MQSFSSTDPHSSQKRALHVLHLYVGSLPIPHISHSGIVDRLKMDETSIVQKPCASAQADAR